MRVLPAVSVAATVTAFDPGCSATVAVQVPLLLTVVFTPFTVMVDPGSAFPERTVFEPVTVAFFRSLIVKAGAVVSFSIVIVRGKEDRQPEAIARMVNVVFPSPTGICSSVNAPSAFVLTMTSALPDPSKIAMPTLGEAVPWRVMVASLVVVGESFKSGLGK